jgi:iron complex transport system substrate-binding protein
METALAVSDQYERGLISDISGFASWCDRVSEKIAGKPLDEQQRFTFSQTLPPVLAHAFGALLNGAAAKERN